MKDKATLSELDQRVDFLNAVQHRDSSGGISFTTSPYSYPNARTIWAKVERAPGTERLEADTPTSFSRAKIECRFIPGITTLMVVSWQSLVWQIVSVDQMPRHDRLIVHAERRGQSGSGDP